MEPKERLDILLSQRQTGEAMATNPGLSEPASSEGINGIEAGEPEALLAAADGFAVWGTSEPAPAFADQLEAKLLARFAAPLEDVRLHGVTQVDAPGAGGREDRPALMQVEIRSGSSLRAPQDSGGWQQATDREEIQSQRASASAGRALRAPRTLRPRRILGGRSASRRLWQAVAAAVLLVVGVGALAVAALGAGPGQTLYSVHRIEQGVWTDLATSPDERARLHLQYAQEALDAFDATVAQHGSAQSDRDAVATFEQEMQAAENGIAGLPAGDARVGLTAQLASLRSRAEKDLLAALPRLDWSLRADVTVALGQLGVSVPQITQASIAGASHDGSYLWTVTVTGSGFAPGAALLIDGRPTGTIVSRSATTLVAQIGGNQLSDGAHVVGVGNPDGTLGIVTGIISSHATDDHGGSSGPGGSSGGGENHGGSGGDTSGGGGSSGGGSGSGDGSGSGHGGSGGSATPTPSPTATPDEGGR